jgi:hypothetical protein
LLSHFTDAAPEVQTSEVTCFPEVMASIELSQQELISPSDFPASHFIPHSSESFSDGPTPSEVQKVCSCSHWRVLSSPEDRVVSVRSPALLTSR